MPVQVILDRLDHAQLCAVRRALEHPLGIQNNRRFLAWLDEHGGRRQIRMDELSAEIGLHPRTVKGISARLQLLGVLVVQRGQNNGKGAEPNIYIAQVTAAQWDAYREELLNEVLSRLLRVKKDKRNEMARTRRQRKAAERERTVIIPSVTDIADLADDADAWLA